jgi:hypothetical protein
MDGIWLGCVRMMTGGETMLGVSKAIEHVLCTIRVFEEVWEPAMIVTILVLLPYHAGLASVVSQLRHISLPEHALSSSLPIPES